jgi:hypothetical protein
MNLRGIKWTGIVADNKEIRNAYKISSGKQKDTAKAIVKKSNKVQAQVRNQWGL